MVRILIVEDDDKVRLATKLQLSDSYSILEAEDGMMALEIMQREHVDMCIVDIQMPNMNGYEFLKELRKSGDNIPVILLTAMTGSEYKRKGFGFGTDDYVTKPVDYDELKWRIQALLRRAKISENNEIRIGNLLINEESHEVTLNGEEIPLTNKEFDLLFKFLSYPDVIFTKQKLLDEIWGYESDTEYDTIKTYISKLRSKFSDCEDFEIVAVRGLGYKAVVNESLT